MSDRANKAEIRYLAEKFYASRANGKEGVEVRQGRVSVTIGPHGMRVVLLNDPKANVWQSSVVYSTERDHAAEEKAGNREMEKMGLFMKARRFLYKDSAFDSKLAPEMIKCLRQASVLDLLGDI